MQPKKGKKFICVCARAGPVSSGVEMSNENFAYEYEPFYTEQNFTGLGRRFTPPPRELSLPPKMHAKMWAGSSWLQANCIQFHIHFTLA